MRFGNIHLAYLLWFIVVIVLFYLWSLRRKTKAMGEFAQEDLMQELTQGLSRRRQRLKLFLIVGGLSLLLFSLVRPQWGFHWQEIKRRGLDIIVAIDTSNSMLAEDVRPNRLERSKLAVKDLIRELKGDRIGLIAFSGEAFLVCPLTIDYNGFVLSLDSIDAGAIPTGGTSISSAIEEARRGYQGTEKKYKVLIIITDGEDHIGDAVKIAKEASRQGIKIFCIGIGTKGGELIPVSDQKGQRGFLKDSKGNFVKSRLSEDVLKKIALNTGGSYIRATGAEFGLDLIYEQKLSKMEKRELEGKMEKRYEERFQIPLSVAFLLLILEPFISERKAIR